MGKRDRKALIAAEVARRERESGVPPGRFVYAMRPLYAEEGGPRSFVPALCAEHLREVRSKRALYDGDLWRRVLEWAIESGEAIELILDDAEGFVAGATPADYCEWGLLDDRLMIFSARTAGALGDMLEPCCQRVPVFCHGQEVVGYRLRAVEDVLDAAYSEGWWDDYKLRRRASDIKSYSFVTERLGRSAIFSVPEHWQTLVLQRFVDVVRGGGFNGFKFRKVWPRTTLELWV